MAGHDTLSGGLKIIQVTTFKLRERCPPGSVAICHNQFVVEVDIAADTSLINPNVAHRSSSHERHGSTTRFQKIGPGGGLTLYCRPGPVLAIIADRMQRIARTRPSLRYCASVLTVAANPVTYLPARGGTGLQREIAVDQHD
jgi:hypothetical protein